MNTENINKRLLKWLTVIVPVVFWILVEIAQIVMFTERRLRVESLVLQILVLAIGAWFFSTWVFNVIENREIEIRRRTAQLEALHSAALSLTTELDLGLVLHKVVELSTELVDAQYGALGVLDEEGQYIQSFFTAGLTPEERSMVGALPQGRGILGVMVNEGKAVRIDDIQSDPRSAGFPEHHPTMRSLLGVPIRSKGKVIGNLYLTNKIVNKPDGQIEQVVFSDDDLSVLEMFATQAAIAIENAQLYRQTQQLAILQERERFGMDLHDGIIQSIYAIGLMLEDTQHRIGTEPDELNERLTRSIQDLNDVIRDIRNYILDLRPQRFQGRDLVRGLEELARDLRANTFLIVNINSDSDYKERSLISPEQTVEILHIAQEALTNVRKHARALEVEINLTRVNSDLNLVIEDDGVGIDRTLSIVTPTSFRDLLSQRERMGKLGNGLRNMRERAISLNGRLSVEPRSDGGTRVTLNIPLK